MSSSHISYFVVAVVVAVALLLGLGVIGGGEVTVPTGTPDTAG